MATNVLYVTPTAPGQGQPGNPLSPYGLLAALAVAAGAPGRPLILYLSAGRYDLSCDGRALNLIGQLSICAPSSRQTVLSVAGLLVPIGSTVSLSNVALQTCPTGASDHFLNVAGSLSIVNSAIAISRGQLMAMSYGLLTLNSTTVNLGQSFSLYTILIDASTGGLIANNCLFNATYPGPLTGNSALIGLDAGTGFASLQNCRFQVKLNGGGYALVGLYNANVVKSCALSVQGTGTESFIVLGTDIPQATSTSGTGSTGQLHVDGLVVAASGLAGLYGTFNTTGYPLDLVGFPSNLPPYEAGQSLPAPARQTTPVQQMSAFVQQTAPAQQYSSAPIAARQAASTQPSPLANRDRGILTDELVEPMTPGPEHVQIDEFPSKLDEYTYS